ncbi:MAG: 1,4-alpha-glucan branching protein, partial [Planctomycetales bacterium]|nr:1,4-alpha-glucan branching protein [Planctomycetales bacterium]
MSAVAHSPNVAALGAIPLDRGVSFRVWAPHADSVAVVGSFNHWDDQAHRCQRQDQGCWSVIVDDAKIGDEYKFVITRQKQRFERIDPRARAVTNSVGNAVVVANDFDWQGDQFHMPPWNETVIYEMHIGTFHRTGESVGSFDTAIERLPYLRDLGINAVELMPLAEFAGDYSWGYNPAHPYAVETAYGGPDGLKRFIRASHQHGIAVIVDVVYNHFGPSDLSLWQFDGWSENDKGGIYFYNDWRSATPWGDTRPDYGRREVREYIFDNALMWLEDYHADGLRYDMTLYMRSVDGDESKVIPDGFSLAQQINSEIHNRFPGKILIAEDLRNNNSITLDGEHGGAHFS